jgi:hypothetical protein
MNWKTSAAEFKWATYHRLLLSLALNYISGLCGWPRTSSDSDERLMIGNKEENEAAKVAGAAAVGAGVKLAIEEGAEAGAFLGSWAGPVGTIVGAAVGAGVAWWLLH